jgi:cytochrome c oxidase cbb3-type subunit 3
MDNLYTATMNHPFWSVFIIIGTVGGIIGLVWLILWMSGTTTKPGEQVETMGHVWDEDLAEYNNPLPSWWLGLFYITLIFGAVYLLLYPGLGAWGGILGWSTADEYEKEKAAAEKQWTQYFEQFKDKSIEDLAKDKQAVETGHRLFLNHCALCHGSDAKGNPGYPNLTDNDWLYGGTPEAIETTINKGRKATGMMAWQTQLGGEAEVKNVAQYVLSLSGREHDASAAAKGKAKFMMCVGCHGMDGKGNQMIGAPNLTDKIWLYGGDVKTIETSIANGRAGKMPAHGKLLGEEKVRMLATYVYSLRLADQ